MLVILSVFQHKQSLVELESEEHEILVDPVVVHLVPVQVEYVYKCFKPLFLFSIINSPEVSEDMA